MIARIALLLAPAALLIAAVCGPADASPRARQSAGENVTSAPNETAASPITLVGLTGRLTYETASDEVTVQLPDAIEIGRRPTPPPTTEQSSADGEWRSTTTCADPGSCAETIVTLVASDGARRELAVASLIGLQWAPSGHALALEVASTVAPGNVMVLVDPARDEPRTVAPSAGGFAWRDDSSSLVVALDIDARSTLMRVDLDGTKTPVGKLRDLPPYLYPSPDRRRFAYTASDAAGWRIHVYDDGAQKVIFSAAMGSDGPGATPVPIQPAEQKSPMYIAWSPDSTKLAFGGGYAPPYFMTLIDLTTGVAHRTDFPDGYPGEIKWSMDGKMLAVSTYDPERRHHGAYVVDPETGAARYLVSGCHLVWSPDGRFLALRGEQDPGGGIVDVATGNHAQLTNGRTDVPTSWIQ